jgi:hypothetical protein
MGLLKKRTATIRQMMPTVIKCASRARGTRQPQLYPSRALSIVVARLPVPKGIPDVSSHQLCGLVLSSGLHGLEDVAMFLDVPVRQS